MQLCSAWLTTEAFGARAAIDVPVLSYHGAPISTWAAAGSLDRRQHAAFYRNFVPNNPLRQSVSMLGVLLHLPSTSMFPGVKPPFVGPPWH